MKRIALLGSTGSIGLSALDVVTQFPDEFTIAGLGVSTSVLQLAKQCEAYRPSAVYIADEERAKTVSLPDERIRIYSGADRLVDFVNETEFDILVNALVGSVGFLPTLAAIQKGKTVALANKETLVMGGDIIMPLVKENGVDLIPIDSEHSAIFQIVRHFKDAPIHKIILTASGGPFRAHSATALEAVTREEALKHPTWNMGHKITIDSATMMNKGLEVIEAHHLFGVPYAKIEALIHPQSVVHSIVEFADGEQYAQMGPTNMRYPIQTALSYPRMFETPYARLNLADVGTLTFERPDAEKFPLLALAYRFGSQGGAFPTAFNASNEVAVEAFLRERIRFVDIPKTVERVTESFTDMPVTAETLLQVDAEARAKAKEALGLGA